MHLTNVFNRIWTDLKRKEFLSLKFLYFMVYGGMYTLLPFLNIQARSLGIKEEEIGSILGILPIFFVFATSGIGILADKIGNFKVLLSITMATSGLTSLTFLAIPVARVTRPMPEQLPLRLNCSAMDYAAIDLMAPYTCDYFASDIYTAYITECRYKCNSERKSPAILWELNYSDICSVTNGCNHSNAESDSNIIRANKTEENHTLKKQLKFPFDLILRNHSDSILSTVTSLCSTINRNRSNSLVYHSGSEGSEGHEGQVESLEGQDDCRLECDAEVARKEMCSNDVTVEEIRPGLTFALYVLVRLLHALSLVFALPLFEGATIAVLQEYRGDIGLQRMYSNLGMVILTPLSGVLIDTFSPDHGTNFRPAFYLYVATTTLSAICILFVKLEFKKPAKKIRKELKSLLSNFEVISFIFAGFIVGIANGVIDAFLFWTLENMGASKSLMGLTVTVGSSTGIVIMIFATPIIEKIGHVNTLIIGLVTFVVRLLGYSFLSNPWWAMPFEAMECLTTALFGVAQLSYATTLSTPSTIVSLQTLTMGVMHGAGRGCGGLLGGFLAKGFGLRGTFMGIAALCMLSAVVYFALNFFFFRKKERERKAVKENVEKKNESDDRVIGNINNNTLREKEKEEYETSNEQTCSEEKREQNKLDEQPCSEEKREQIRLDEQFCPEEKRGQNRLDEQICSIDKDVKTENIV